MTNHDQPIVPEWEAVLNHVPGARAAWLATHHVARDDQNGRTRRNFTVDETRTLIARDYP